MCIIFKAEGVLQELYTRAIEDVDKMKSDEKTWFILFWMRLLRKLNCKLCYK
jgi:hypothetical protein